MIRGLRFTTKGGERSGHHGHAGVPGQLGGSAPGNRLATMLLNDSDFQGLSWSSWRQRMLLDVTHGIPDSHTEGMTLKFDNERLDELSGKYGLPACGEYDSNNDVVRLHTEQGTWSPHPLAHEVGHRVWHKFPLDKRVIEEDYGTAGKLTVEKIEEIGLDWSSAINASEFWADGYSLWARVRANKPFGESVFSPNRTTLLEGQKQFRELLPNTAIILDEVFK